MIFKFGKTKPLPPVMKMLVPGRRALGETWQEVTIRPTAEGGYTTEKQPSKAPATGQPVLIPAMANLSDEECNFILEGARKNAEYESRQKKKVTEADISRMVNQMWRDYMEQKLAMFKGTSQFGPKGKTQRDHYDGPTEFNPRGW